LADSNSIVAIHGLNGHAWDSFAADFDLGESPNREVSWLQDILPGRLLRSSLSARILTFGYSTERWYRWLDGESDIESPGEKLTRLLRRNRLDVCNRPLDCTLLNSKGS
jgi:hypothetical protein